MKIDDKIRNKFFTMGGIPAFPSANRFVLFLIKATVPTLSGPIIVETVMIGYMDSSDRFLRDTGRPLEESGVIIGWKEIE